MGVLSGKTIVLGVSGGIAAYKSAELVRLLVTSGANVRVMMTRNATEFITPLTLQTLSSNPVATDTFSLTQESEIGHIRLADSADAIVIAPATADVIAKAAVGIADDILTTVLLATRAKVAFAPSMNVHMYDHPTVAENLAKLHARGAVIIEPAEGALACGYEGKGRLPDPAIVVAEVEKMLSPQDLAGENILVTAGPTQEPIDPVRFVTNRSSGKMGFAIARAAWRRGASVRLIAGPSPLLAKAMLMVELALPPAPTDLLTTAPLMTGRSLFAPSPLLSTPVVALNGRADASCVTEPAVMLYGN